MMSWYWSSGRPSEASVTWNSSRVGRGANQVGERCSITAFAHLPAIAGISVAAVAPEPITTTVFPSRSWSSGQVWGCRISPLKSSMPGQRGV